MIDKEALGELGALGGQCEQLRRTAVGRSYCSSGGADRVGEAQRQWGHGILSVSSAFFSLLNSFRSVLSGFDECGPRMVKFVWVKFMKVHLANRKHKACTLPATAQPPAAGGKKNGLLLAFITPCLCQPSLCTLGFFLLPLFLSPLHVWVMYWIIFIKGTWGCW